MKQEAENREQGTACDATPTKTQARRGRPHWTARTPASLLQRVAERLAQGDAPRHLYEMFDVRRYAAWTTFAAWCRVNAREQGTGNREQETATDLGAAQAGAVCTPSPATSTAGNREQGTERRADLFSVSPSELRSQVLQRLADAVTCGSVPMYVLVQILEKMVRLEELNFKAAAEQRAEELHAIKLAELRRRQEAALVENAGPAGLTAEQLAVIKSKVLGL